MNKKKTGFVHLGFSSVLMVFTMLCLVTFAALSLITANSDYRLSRKMAEKTTNYYQADTIAKEYLLQLDTSFAEIYEQSETKDEFLLKVPASVSSVPIDEAMTVPEFEAGENGSFVSFQVTVNDVQTLHITLKLYYPEHPGDEFYTITQWQTVTTNEPVGDDGALHLFQGNE